MASYTHQATSLLLVNIWDRSEGRADYLHRRLPVQPLFISDKLLKEPHIRANDGSFLLHVLVRLAQCQPVVSHHVGDADRRRPTDASDAMDECLSATSMDLIDLREAVFKMSLQIHVRRIVDRYFDALNRGESLVRDLDRQI